MKEQKVSLPKAFKAVDNLNYTLYYDHFDRHKDCDYSFLMRGNFVDSVRRAKNVKSFVLPSFNEKAIHMVVKGVFEGMKDASLIVTGSSPIKFCGMAFDKDAKIKLVLPKDMCLFEVRQKVEMKNGFLSLTFPMIAKSNFKLPGDDFFVEKVNEIESEKLPYKISVDKEFLYDRVTHSVKEKSLSKEQ